MAERRRVPERMLLPSRSVRTIGRWFLGITLGWLGACSAAPEDALSGRWAGQSIESLDGSVSAARAGWAKGTSLAFSGSQLTVTLPGQAPRKGSYQVLASDDGKIEIEVEGHSGHVDRTRLTLETDRLLRWHLNGVHTLVLHRI